LRSFAVESVAVEVLIPEPVLIAILPIRISIGFMLICIPPIFNGCMGGIVGIVGMVGIDALGIDDTC
jgi:hypothetical protein